MKKTLPINIESETASSEIKNIKNQMAELAQKLSELDVRVPEEIKEALSLKRSIEQLKGRYKDYESIYNDMLSKTSSISSSATTAANNLEVIKSVRAQIDTIRDEINTIKEAIDQNPDIVEDIDTMNDQIADVSTMHEQAEKDKNEIRKLYRTIFGYTTTNAETGETKQVQGLKHELDETYEALKTNISNFEKTTKQNYTDNIAEWTNQYNAIKSNIESLLPGAMSAGLAEAYKTKRENEEDSYRWGYVMFIIMIVILACVAAIPAVVVIKLILNQMTLTNALAETPRLTLALSPVYAALIWAGAFQNKKLNLSKKLIEEYSHKEATAKTFAGLAKQISEVGDDDVSKALKTKLLEQTLDATAKNPSDCITNHEKSDNPMFSLLNMSEKLIKQAGGAENVSKILAMASEMYLEKHKKTQCEKTAQKDCAEDDEQD